MVALNRLRDQRRRGRVGEIRDDHGRVAWQLQRQGPQAIFAAGDQYELDAVLRGETAGGRLADPAGRTGDQCHVGHLVLDASGLRADGKAWGANGKAIRPPRATSGREALVEAPQRQWHE